MRFQGGMSVGPLLAIVVALLAGGCVSTRSSLQCRASEAIICSESGCAPHPDGNPNVEFTLDSRTGMASVCIVTACHDVRWTGRSGRGVLLQGGKPFGYRLHLNGAGDQFRLISADGVGWRGSCERRPST